MRTRAYYIRHAERERVRRAANKNAPKQRPASYVCGKCGEPGHNRRRHAFAPVRNYCTRCGELGHNVRTCKAVAAHPHSVMV